MNTVPDEFSSHVAPVSFGSVARVLTAPGAGAVAVISVTLTPGEDPAAVRFYCPHPEEPAEALAKAGVSKDGQPPRTWPMLRDGPAGLLSMRVKGQKVRSG